MREGPERPAGRGTKRPLSLCLELLALQISHLIEQNILKSAAAIAQEPPQPAIDKVGEQNAVARFYLRPNQTDRMPGIIGNGEGVAGIGREQHLRVFRLFTIW